MVRVNVYDTKNIPTSGTVIDAGAGIGEFSVLASQLVGPKGRVLAIEPSPDDFATLELNLAENKCSNVIPINKAISDRAGKLELIFKGKRFLCTSDSLANIINESGIGFKKIDFMKMDIEGGERFVIPSSIDIIKNIRFLAMEIHDNYQSSLIPYMEGFDFKFERITRRKYIRNSLDFVIAHPVQAYTLARLLKGGGEYPGLMKMSRGIDISNSNNLVVGTFKRRISSLLPEKTALQD